MGLESRESCQELSEVQNPDAYRWFPGPNFQVNRLSVLAAICDNMQFGPLRWILQ